MNENFNTSFGIKLTVPAVIREIKSFIEEKKDFHYKIIVGTDSLRISDNLADFVIAIVVHRMGNGGRYFWRRIETSKVFSLRDRIIKEVMFSLETAKKILQEIEKANLQNFDFEIHIDVGENGETKKLIQEVVGIVRANNLEPKTKPESYAASSVADRLI
jgi:predicted RNase H-related nuclease YkuK (DUF458 family)